jgi:hypothetical protein
LAIACAIRLACSSVGEDFGWVRLIEAPPRIIANDSRELVSFLSDLAISTHIIRALGVGQVEKGIIRLGGLLQFRPRSSYYLVARLCVPSALDVTI